MKGSVARLASVALVGAVIGKGLRYGLNIVVARGLGAEALGLFAFGLVVLKAGAIVARLGLNRGVQKFVPVYLDADDRDAVYGVTVLSHVSPLIVGSLLAVTLYLGAPYLSGIVRDEYVQVVRPFAVAIPLYAVFLVSVTETKAFKETKYFVYARDLLQSGGAIVFVAVGALVFADLGLAIGGYHLSLIFGVVCSIYFLWRLGAFEGSAPSFPTRALFSFSVPLMAAAVSFFFISWTDVLMLSTAVSAREMGWYQAAFQTSVLLLFVLQACNSIFPSVASDLHSRGELGELSQLYWALTKWVSTLTLLGLVYVVAYRDLALGLFGEPIPSAAAALVILCIGQTVNAGTGPAGFLLIMSGNERLQTVNAVFVVLLNVALNWLLIARFGIAGAAAATAISFTILNVLRLVEAYYYLGISPPSGTFARSLTGVVVASAFVLAAATYLPRTYAVAVIVGGGALLIYGASNAVVAVDASDRILVQSLD